MSEDSWLDFVEHVVETLDVGPGTRVFQVGCGSGELLLPLQDNGYHVGGLDQNTQLIEEAKRLMPEGRFLVGDASTLDPGEPWDVVLACGAFEHFPDLDYARGVLARMAAKATHAMAILDVPDSRYERAWMLRALTEIGVKAIQIEEHGDDRFNVFARL